MKILLSFITTFIIGISFSQTFNYVTHEEYDSLKSIGGLVGNEVLLSTGMVNPDKVNGVNYIQNYYPTKAGGCSGYTDPLGPPLDVSLAPDDGVDIPVTLPFTFCFFGDNYTNVHMNNNGNISFDALIMAFTANAFPSNGNKMIAAFWGDFDFSGGGTMHATVTPTAAIFNW